MSFLLGGNTDLILKDQRQCKVAVDQKGTESLLEISSHQSVFGAASNHTSSEVKEHFYGNCNENSDWKGNKHLSLQVDEDCFKATSFEQILGEDTKGEMQKQNEKLR